MRVVLVRLSALGDIVHAWPLAEALLAERPDLRLTWVVEEPFRFLVEGHPAVDVALTINTRGWRRAPLSSRTRTEVARLRSRFGELRPELAIDPQGVLKSAVVTRWSSAAARVGLARPWRRELIAGWAYTTTLPGSASDPHVVATNLELVRAVGGTPPPHAVPPDGSWLRDRLQGIAPPSAVAGGCAVLVPGAGSPRKLLPVATLAEVAHGIVEIGLEVVVVWGPGERDRAEAVAAAAGDGVAVAPPTDLGQLTLLLDGARVVVGGDTGPVHLAASLGVPTVALFNATDWRRNGPLGPAVAVVSGALQTRDRPSASAWATPLRPLVAGEVLDAVSGLLDRPRR